ncbi:FkbM family methyltransferase [Cognatishimia sp. SS12]|nr:FkbM family methyltransferase [Cognatishimia sp. SS12]
MPLVRLGPEDDGGYLLPDDLDGIAALFSPGVSDTVGFDHEIARRGIDCFLMDASVEEPDHLLPNMQFQKTFLGARDADPFVTLPSWIKASVPNDGDLILQMDIEGAEYDVLPHVSAATLDRFRIILLEIHDLHKMWQADWLARFGKILNQLNANHLLCHIHANNTAPYFSLAGHTIPDVLELTYIRKDRVSADGSIADVPHPLDRPNCTKTAHFPTPKIWEMQN